MGDARTVKVRIAVAVDEDGSINGYFIHECRPEAAALRWAMHGMKRPYASIIEADERETALNIESFCLGKFRPSIYAVTGRDRLSSEWVEASAVDVMETVLWYMNQRGDQVERQPI